MAYHELSSIDFSSNSRMPLEEALLECLLKAEASAYIATSDEFLELDKSIVYGFIWILSDLISHATSLSEQLAYQIAQMVN